MSEQNDSEQVLWLVAAGAAIGASIALIYTAIKKCKKKSDVGFIAVGPTGPGG